MIVILGIMTGDLSGVIKFIEQFVTQNLSCLRHRSPGVKTVGEDQKAIFFLHTGCIEFFQYHPDGYFPMGSGLAAALDDIRNDDGNFASFVRQL